MNTNKLISNETFDVNYLDHLAYTKVAENLATIIKNSVTEIQLVDIEIQLIVLAIETKITQTTPNTDALLNKIITVIQEHRHPCERK